MSTAVLHLQTNQIMKNMQQAMDKDDPDDLRIHLGMGIS